MAKQEATLLLRIKQVGAAALKNVGSLISNIGKVSLAAGTAVTGFAALTISKWRDQELAVNKLNQTLVQQGIFTNKLSKEYQGMAAELQKTTLFGDEATIAAIAQLQAYSGQTKITKELTAATQDFAQGMGVDLKTAADLIGKTMSSSTNALSRYGIEVDVTASKQEKMEQITKALNDRFGGQAAAAAQGTGSIIQLQNAFGDVLEVIGKNIAPLVTVITKRLTTFTTEIQTNKDALLGLQGVVTFVAKAFSNLFTAINIVGQTIGTGLAASVEATSQLLSGQFSRAKETAQLGVQEVGEIIMTELEANRERMIEFDMAEQEREEQNLINSENRLKQSMMRKRQILAEEEKKKIADDKKKQEEQKKKDAKDLLVQQKKDSDQIALRKQTLNTIATLQQSNNKALAIIGKAAALTQIAIETPVAVSKALSAFPPPINFVAAAAVGAAMAVQAAKVAGIQLAEGGLVHARPGGVQATIGEGGRDELVTPLDDLGGGGLGTTINITVNGGLMGDEQSAQEFASALDQELLKLRQSNEAVSFDEGIV